ncbi:MAG: hypothetical protein ACHQF2_09305 [Flavobacteriales bacterium]
MRFSLAIVLILSFSSCSLKLTRKNNAVNFNKLSRIYIVNKDGINVEYKSENEWKENTSRINPWGYSVLKRKDKPFSGVAIRYFRKGILKIPTAYAVFNYKDGFINGQYKYCLMNGTVLIEGEAKPNNAPDWDQSNHLNGPIFNGGLGLRELDRSRKEFIVREKVYNVKGRLTSHYVKDSLYFYISELHDTSIEVWEEFNYEMGENYSIRLRTAQNGDTLYYRFFSDTLEITVEKQPYHPKHKFYDNKSEYVDNQRIDEWSKISGYRYRKNKDEEITTTLEGDTIELINLANGKYHGRLLKFTPTGDTIEKINFTDGLLDGIWIKYNSKGDTLHFRNFSNGRKYGKWIGPASDELCTEFPGRCSNSYYIYEANYNEKGLLEGTVKIYWEYLNEKKLRSTGSMKNGLKNGVFIFYNDLTRKITSKTEFVNGMEHGEHESYFHKSGTLRERGRFEFGKMTGKWTYWRDYEKGIVSSEGEYLNGKEIGEWIYYNEDGTVNRKEKY